MQKWLYNTQFVYRGIRHILFFAFTVLFFTMVLLLQNSDANIWGTFSLTAINAMFFFAYAYISIFILIREFLLKGRIVWFVVLFLLVGVALSALKLVFSDYIFYSTISSQNIEKTGAMNLRFIVVNTKDMTFIVALFCIAKYVKDYIYAESIRKRLEIQNKKAQNKLLQSQFDPHFLFNTINNLYALSLLNPTQTQEVIGRLNMVLKYIIDECQKDFLALGKEISLVENYIQLEKLRYGKRLKVDFVSNGNVDGLKIPPLLLFLLVENSFKHGSSLDAGNPWIKIKVNAQPGLITFSTENSKPQSSKQANNDYRKGSGLSSLQKRLDIIYKPSGYKLKIEDKGTTFSVKLALKDEIEFRQTTYRK